jgi:hypothetical protein
MAQEAQFAVDPDEQLQTRPRFSLAEPEAGLEAGGGHVPDVLFAKVGQASRLPGWLRLEAWRLGGKVVLCQARRLGLLLGLQLVNPLPVRRRRL